MASMAEKVTSVRMKCQEFSLLMMRPVYSVELATNGGRVQALSSINRAEIEAIVRALNESISARG